MSREKETQMIDWIKIRNDYISTKVSLRALAEKYGVNFSSVQRRCTKEDWVSQRKSMRVKVQSKSSQKIEEKISDSEADRMSRILNIADGLIGKIEEAVGVIQPDDARNLKNLVSATNELKKMIGTDGNDSDRKAAEALLEIFKSDSDESNDSYDSYDSPTGNDGDDEC